MLANPPESRFKFVSGRLLDLRLSAVHMRMVEGARLPGNGIVYCPAPIVFVARRRASRIPGHCHHGQPSASIGRRADVWTEMQSVARL